LTVAPTSQKDEGVHLVGIKLTDEGRASRTYIIVVHVKSSKIVVGIKRTINIR
jgi:hypothetical protein